MNAGDLLEVRHRYEAGEISRTIAPDDQMWQSGSDWYYFDVGRSGIDAILAGLAHSPLERVVSILDLPCGHGRVARHLRAAFPEAKVSYCDLMRSGVDFCRDTFGGEGIYSDPDLTKTRLGTYDLIWVGSLFTHVSKKVAATWLRRLCSCLTPQGVLVATFHGRWSLELNKSYPLTTKPRFRRAMVGRLLSGWGYAPYPGSKDGAYGISLATPAKVLAMASGIRGVRTLSYTERGWADNHDVLVLGGPDRLTPLTQV